MRLPRDGWRASGALNFPIDPDEIAAQHPAIWHHESAAAIIIMQGPVERSVATAEALSAGRVMARRRSRSGLHVVVRGTTMRHRLLVVDNAATDMTCFAVPQAEGIEVRLAALSQLHHGRACGLRLTGSRLLRPNAYQRFRLQRMLLILDEMRSGSTQRRSLRELARAIFPQDTEIQDIGSTAWKSSSQRRQLQRLRTEAIEMAQVGYRRLLQQGMRRK